jgi:hypothetical protein
MGGKPGPEAGTNNLSFPVIWAEGVAEAPPGTAGMDPQLDGEYWYQWGFYGTGEDQVPASCRADPQEGDPLLNPDGLNLCDDEDGESVDLSLVPGIPPADTPLDLAKVFIQKDAQNVWQAWSGDAAASGEAEPDGKLFVDSIDWGDNLESVDWYTRSQVRTEVVLFQDLATPQLEYAMRHTSGWGIDEVHGLEASLDVPPIAVNGPGSRATVYTHCARLTIQKLLVAREHPNLANLEWNPGAGIWQDQEGSLDDLINEDDIFNMAVWEGGDGPGYYSAEINVKGRIIFGYTWNVRKLNESTVNGGEAAGDYRITFSLDAACGATLNTFFVDGVTGIIVPAEEDVVVTAEEGEDGGSTGGAVGVLVPAEFDIAGNLIGGNLTYMDVRIPAPRRTGGSSHGRCGAARGRSHGSPPLAFVRRHSPAGRAGRCVHAPRRRCTRLRADLVARECRLLRHPRHRGMSSSATCP